MLFCVAYLKQYLTFVVLLLERSFTCLHPRHHIAHSFSNVWRYGIGYSSLVVTILTRVINLNITDMKNLFKDCSTWDEAKTMFRKLSKSMHPDLGGTHEQFIELKRQFELFTPSFSKDSTFANQTFDKRKFADIIEELKDLDEVEITFAGTFIWIEGNTYSQKDKIKAIQLQGYNKARFASKKKAWYFSPIDYKKKSKKLYNMDDIKQMFGADSYKQNTLKITV